MGINKHTITDEWPGGISDTLNLSCGHCGHWTYLDYRVDDEFWKQVVPEKMRLGVICLGCLDYMATENGLDISEHIEDVQYTGIKKTILLKPTDVYYYERDQWSYIHSDPLGEYPPPKIS